MASFEERTTFDSVDSTDAKSKQIGSSSPLSVSANGENNNLNSTDKSVAMENVINERHFAEKRDDISNGASSAAHSAAAENNERFSAANGAMNASEKSKPAEANGATPSKSASNAKHSSAPKSNNSHHHNSNSVERKCLSLRQFPNRSTLFIASACISRRLDPQPQEEEERS